MSELALHEVQHPGAMGGEVGGEGLRRFRIEAGARPLGKSDGPGSMRGSGGGWEREVEVVAYQAVFREVDVAGGSPTLRQGVGTVGRRTAPWP